jgi:predicted dehydrogenase
VILTLSHPLDYLRWLLGEVESLWAFASRLGELEVQVEDIAEIGLRFAGGALGSVHLDYNQHPPSHHMEIIGTQGTIQWDNSNGATRSFRQGGPDWEIFSLPPGFERNDLFLEQMRHLLDVVNGGAAPICTLEDGIEALRLALAAHISQSQGKIVHF